LPLLQSEVEADVSLKIGGGNQIFHHPVRHRPRLSAIHQQAIDAQRAIDASPPIARAIDNDKDVAGKEWRRDCLHLPRVSWFFEWRGTKVRKS
jgi:hypothetical protein